MAEKPFHLEIITPRKAAYKGDVVSFTAPGVVGGFQVLHSHAQMLSSLKVGEVKITDVAGAEFKYAISGGFTEIRNNNVILLAETAERVDEIDAERAKSARDRAQKRIAEKKSDTDIERARLALYRALNRLKVTGSH
jgi:F-type H+-transporting ATPase subunit epsilon